MDLSVVDITVPFVQRLQAASGPRSGSSAAGSRRVLGLTYYVRGRIGPRAGAGCTASPRSLGARAGHALGEGTDAGRRWFLAAVGIVVPAAALLLAIRSHPCRPPPPDDPTSPTCARSPAGPACAGSAPASRPVRPRSSSRCSPASTCRWRPATTPRWARVRAGRRRRRRPRARQPPRRHTRLRQKDSGADDDRGGGGLAVGGGPEHGLGASASSTGGRRPGSRGAAPRARPPAREGVAVQPRGTSGRMTSQRLGRAQGGPVGRAEVSAS